MRIYRLDSFSFHKQSRFSQFVNKSMFDFEVNSTASIINYMRIPLNN